MVYTGMAREYNADSTGVNLWVTLSTTRQALTINLLKVTLNIGGRNTNPCEFVLEGDELRLV